MIPKYFFFSCSSSIHHNVTQGGDLSVIRNGMALENLRRLNRTKNTALRNFFFLKATISYFCKNFKPPHICKQLRPHQRVKCVTICKPPHGEELSTSRRMWACRSGSRRIPERKPARGQREDTHGADSRQRCNNVVTGRSSREGIRETGHLPCPLALRVS